MFENTENKQKWSGDGPFLKTFVKLNEMKQAKTKHSTIWR